MKFVSANYRTRTDMLMSMTIDSGFFGYLESGGTDTSDSLTRGAGVGHPRARACFAPAD